MKVLVPGFRGAEGREEDKGVIARRGLEEVRSKSAGRRTGTGYDGFKSCFRSRFIGLQANPQNPVERKIPDKIKRNRFHEWMKKSADEVGVAPKVFNTLDGTVFEIRQGYKSKDSKRQNADIANAATAYTKAYLPCAAILSTQIDSDVLYRYRGEKWAVITGIVGARNPLISTYDFMRDVVGYDLAGFFARNGNVLRKEIELVLKALLIPEG